MLRSSRRRSWSCAVDQPPLRRAELLDETNVPKDQAGLRREVADQAFLRGVHRVVGGHGDRDGPEELAPVADLDDGLALDRRQDVAVVANEVLPTIEGETVVEVRDRGELLGALSVAMPPNDPMDPSKERLVRDLASQAGLVLRNVRLVEELRASQRRLVTAQDHERRRLERNIHDGAQQQLVALSVKTRLARDLTARDPAKAAEMLTQIDTEIQTALDDLRDLARGIYPPLLVDKGLGAALDAQARRSPVPITIRADGLGRYAPEVEAAVYFSCLEALQNVAKYAEASSATVILAQSNGHLTFEVVDDGRGFDPASQRATGPGCRGSPTGWGRSTATSPSAPNPVRARGSGAGSRSGHEASVPDRRRRPRCRDDRAHRAVRGRSLPRRRRSDPPPALHGRGARFGDPARGLARRLRARPRRSGALLGGRRDGRRDHDRRDRLWRLHLGRLLHGADRAARPVRPASEAPLVVRDRRRRRPDRGAGRARRGAVRRVRAHPGRAPTQRRGVRSARGVPPLQRDGVVRALAPAGRVRRRVAPARSHDRGVDRRRDGRRPRPGLRWCSRTTRAPSTRCGRGSPSGGGSRSSRSHSSADVGRPWWPHDPSSGASRRASGARSSAGWSAS